MNLSQDKQLDDFSYKMHNGKCSICGNEADAYWQQDPGVVKICYQCAMNILPVLFADTLPVLEISRIKKDFANFESNFWKAVSARLSRELKIQKQQG